MKKHLLWTFCLLAVGFASCSDDDEKKTAPTPPGDQATTTPDVSQDLGIQFPVTSINGSWEVFNYTDGKLTSGTLSNPDGTFTISHNPLTIKVEMQYGDSGDESSVETYTNIKVNDKGFATSATYQSTDVYDGETEKTNGQATMAYDADGHITEKQVNSTGPGYTENYKITYTWNNGNLLSVQVEDRYSDNEESGVLTTIYKYTYGEGQPNPGIYFDGMWYMTYDFMWYAGLFGKTTKDIPTSVKYTEIEDGQVYYEYEKTLVPHYNENGSLASLEYWNAAGYVERTYTFGYNGQAVEAYVDPAQKSLETRRAHR
ncbi:DUF4595 domain-containing protein, partial [Paraprevotella clara]